MKKSTVILCSVALFLTSFNLIAQRKLDPLAFQSMLESEENPQLIDVRSLAEFQSGHLENAMNINVNGSEFKKEAGKLDLKKKVYVYCGSGYRSNRAASILVAEGFSDVIDMKGGIKAWKTAELPVSNPE